ncbi:MAG: hypothetical protein QXO54_02810 [Candidatus Methanomethylicaceae archaeon]
MRQGIDSLSVNPDVVVWTRKIVSGIERRVILEEFLKNRKEEEWRLE